MRRIVATLVAILILGVACSEDKATQPEGELIPPISAEKTTSTTTTTIATPTLPQALWDDATEQMQLVEARLDGYDAQQAEADLRRLATDVIRVLRDVRRALPDSDQFRKAALDLARASVDFWQQLADATDCDRSETCVSARHALRAAMQNLREAWKSATTAPSTTAWGG